MGRKLPKIIPRDDIKKILALPNIKCATGLRNRCILQAMYRGGLRVEEALCLAPEDVNFKEGFFYVQGGKGGKDRYTPLDQETINWLQKWAAIRPESDYFFCTLKGGKMDQSYVRHLLRRLSQKANVYIRDGKRLKPVHPHLFRHSFATELLEEGFSIYEVKELLGHSSIATTEVYLHVMPEKLAAKVRARA